MAYSKHFDFLKLGQGADFSHSRLVTTLLCYFSQQFSVHLKFPRMTLCPFWHSSVFEERLILLESQQQFWAESDGICGWMRVNGALNEVLCHYQGSRTRNDGTVAACMGEPLLDDRTTEEKSDRNSCWKL